MFYFAHEFGGSVKAKAKSGWDKIKLDGSIQDKISESPMLVGSIPSAKGILNLGPRLSKMSFNPQNVFSNFKIVREF